MCVCEYACMYIGSAYRVSRNIIHTYHKEERTHKHTSAHTHAYVHSTHTTHAHTHIL